MAIGEHIKTLIFVFLVQNRDERKLYVVFFLGRKKKSDWSNITKDTGNNSKKIGKGSKKSKNMK